MSARTAPSTLRNTGTAGERLRLTIPAPDIGPSSPKIESLPTSTGAGGANATLARQINRTLANLLTDSVHRKRVGHRAAVHVRTPTDYRSYRFQAPSMSPVHEVNFQAARKKSAAEGRTTR